MKRVELPLIVMLLAWLLSGCATVAEAAGPWRGQVVERESGQPLEGVVVLALWSKVSPGIMHPARSFHDVDEVVTDADGRFTIPARNLSSVNPFVVIEGPRLQMFKGGHGGGRFRPAWLASVGLREGFESFDPAMKLFGESGAIFEMPALKTKEERRRTLSYASPPSEPPARKILRYLDAIDEERAFLGLERMKEDRLKWEGRRKELFK